MGWRQLSEDVRHWAFWLGSGGAFLAWVVSAAWWFRWLYVWNTPPPIMALGVLAASTLSSVLFFCILLISHRYFGRPADHPFYPRVATHHKALMEDNARLRLEAAWAYHAQAARREPRSREMLLVGRTARLVEFDPQTADQRIFVTLTPSELRNIYRLHMTHHADRLIVDYVDKWISVSGSILDIKEDESAILLDVKGTPSDPSMKLVFGHSQRDRVVHLNKGDRIRVNGQIERVDRNVLVLTRCEMVEVLS